MTNQLYQIACNPKIPLETRYRIARYLQQQSKEQRKKERKRESNFRYQLKSLRMNA